MTKLKLSPDGYERIMAKIQSIEDITNTGLFNSDAAQRYLREVYGGLRELRRILHDVCLLTPGTAGPPGPGAA